MTAFTFIGVFAGCRTAREPAVHTAQSPVQEVAEDRVYFFPPDDSLSLPECSGKVRPLKYNIMRVDYPALRGLLTKRPKGREADTLTLGVPVWDGSLVTFRIFPSTVMSPELAAKYPEIRAYSGFGIDDSLSKIRLEISPLGFSSMITSLQGTYLSDPWCITDSVHIIVYRKSDVPPGMKHQFEKK